MSLPRLNISTPEQMQRALYTPIEEQYTPEELKEIAAAILFTRQFKGDESRQRAEEEINSIKMNL
jgi:hypothetical protein